MLSGPDLTLAVALHHERIAAARRHRVVNQARRAHKERETDATRQRRASTAPSDGPIQSPRDPRLAHWLIRVGDVVAHYPIAELDGHRRPALGALVDELLNAARARGADVPSNAVAEDSAVVLLRTLGRLAASTAGRSFPVSRRRARALQTALDDLVNGGHVRVPQSAAKQATDPNLDRTSSAAFTAAIQQVACTDQDAPIAPEKRPISPTVHPG